MFTKQQVMKKILLVLGIWGVSLGAFVFSGDQSNITGVIDPPEGAIKVWAVLGSDSVSTVPSSGKFALSVKPGNWTVVIETVKPYKRVMQTVMVLEGGPSDMGVIKLEKE